MRRNSSLLFSLILLCVVGLPTASKAEGVSIQVIVDNSAALQRMAEAEQYEKMVFYHLTGLRKQRNTKHATLNVISVNNPRNLWVGTPKLLFRNGGELLEKIRGVEHGCSDLVGAFEQAKTNINLQNPDEAYVYVFSSLIHSGAPCSNVTIELPQAAPSTLDLSFMSAMNVKAKFYWVHHLQTRPWLEFLTQAGVRSFELYDEETTKAVLQKGL